MVETLIGEQFKGKDKLIAANVEALNLGREHAQARARRRSTSRVRRADAVGDRIFIEGNNAAGLGAVYGGATVCAWYPITPSTSLAEAFAKHCRRYRVDPVTGKNRYAIVQAEDELASIGIVIGAAWNGARAFTATSGPGISLMQEFIGLAYFAEIPAVIFDVQRGGPSTGMPTRTQQSDILSCAYASHGDTKHVLLFPEDPRECFEFAAALLRPRRPAADADLRHARPRHRHERVAVQAARLGRRPPARPRQGDDRPTSSRAGSEFGRYLDVDGDGIAYRTYPGTHPTKGAFFTRGTSKNRYARYSEEGADYVDNMQRLLRKFETAKRLVPAPVEDRRRRADALRRHLLRLDARRRWARRSRCSAPQGIRLDTLRSAPSPSPTAVADFVAEHDQVFVVEQNRDAQMRTLLVNECGLDPARLVPILHYDGTPITARFIVTRDRRAARGDQRHAAPEGRVMTYIVKPKFHHPALPTNKLGFTHRDYEGTVSTLCAGCGHDSISSAIIQACFELDLPPHRVAKTVRHRLLVEDADLFPRPEPRLQQRARPHAVGGDRRQPRQPRPHLSRRLRRRRLRLDRPRPVRALPPARRQHDLHRREQRRLRPDQGPVLGDRRRRLDLEARRRQHRPADRPRLDGPPPRRELRRRAASPATRRNWCR